MNVRSELVRLQGNLRLQGPTAAGRVGGQESDFWVGFSSRDRRRLAGLGVTAADGAPADVFVQALAELPGVPGWVHEDAGADVVCERWCREILAAADHDGGERERPVDEYEFVELPAWVDAYLDRLAFGPKREYARAFASHVYCGHVAPELVDASWRVKVERKIANRYAAAVGRGQVEVFGDHDGEVF